jgi:hypothetical protein
MLISKNCPRSSTSVSFRDYFLQVVALQLGQSLRTLILENGNGDSELVSLHGSQIRPLNRTLGCSLPWRVFSIAEGVTSFPPLTSTTVE